jgi:hypothetical protein
LKQTTQAPLLPRCRQAREQLADIRKVIPMIRTWAIAPILLTVAALLLGARGQDPKDKKTGKDGSTYQLSSEEQKLVRAISEKALTAKGLINAQERAFMLGKGKEDDKDKVVVAGEEVLPPANRPAGLEPRGEKGPDRKVLVTFYRYRDNKVIRALVDVTNEKTLSVEELPPQPLGFAPEERERVTKLVLANAEIAKLKKEYGDRFGVDLIAPIGAPEKDPAHGHRLAQVNFRLNGAGLTRLLAVVDLTDSTVRVVTLPASKAGK